MYRNRFFWVVFALGSLIVFQSRTVQAALIDNFSVYNGVESVSRSGYGEGFYAYDDYTGLGDGTNPLGGQRYLFVDMSGASSGTMSIGGQLSVNGTAQDAFVMVYDPPPQHEQFVPGNVMSSVSYGYPVPFTGLGFLNYNATANSSNAFRLNVSSADPGIYAQVFVWDTHGGAYGSSQQRVLTGDYVDFPFSEFYNNPDVDFTSLSRIDLQIRFSSTAGSPFSGGAAMTSFEPVPEPSTVVLLSAGGMLLAFLRRRRK
jgi:hypothetical protein